MDRTIDVEVYRGDLRRTRLVERHVTESDGPADGEARLRVGLFALTANNITYGAFGDLMGYWGFFPAPDGWGRIPVWGFADVETSQVPGLDEGERIYGYFPMSTHLVVRPEHLRPGGFVDASPHRAGLPPVYNQYQRVGRDGPGRTEAHDALLRPLFTTSFLLDDWLADNELFGARRIVLSSASSKTALGLAFLLHEAERAEVVGLTSSRHLEFVERVGCYDRAVPYGSLTGEAGDVPTVFVDISGDGRVLEEVHRHHGAALRQSVRVGATHWEDVSPPADLPGPTPSLFFAPDHIQKRRADWGPGGMEERLADAWARLVEWAEGWLTVVHREGAQACIDTYLELLEGDTSPERGYVVSL
jgi:hypothetical protein